MSNWLGRKIYFNSVFSERICDCVPFILDKMSLKYYFAANGQEFEKYHVFINFFKNLYIDTLKTQKLNHHRLGVFYDSFSLLLNTKVRQKTSQKVSKERFSLFFDKKFLQKVRYCFKYPENIVVGLKCSQTILCEPF